MKVGIQRRTVCLTPSMGMDRHWAFQQLERPEIWEMFGLSRGGAQGMRRLHQLGRLVLGIMRLAQIGRRVGFAALFAPSPSNAFWEFSYAIPDVTDRDAFTALHTMDAMAFYAFERLGVKMTGGRTREDNRAAHAIARRAGQQLTHTAHVDGHPYHFYSLDREGWRRRKERLERGEEGHPSPAGRAFVVLPTPPYAPLGRAGEPCSSEEGHTLVHRSAS